MDVPDELDEPGKGKGVNHLTKAENVGTPYVGATNRNDGVMFFTEIDKNSEKLIQNGGCIGFIKNGDGSAGYAIYRAGPFISSSDVIYAYKDGLDRDTGLFLVAAQDMIQEKYSHGYTRNLFPHPCFFARRLLVLSTILKGRNGLPINMESIRKKKTDILFVQLWNLR